MSESSPSSAQPGFPWSEITANVLRTMVRDLGASNKLTKREEMVEFLKDIEVHGLDSALTRITKTETRIPKKEMSASASSARKSNPKTAAAATSSSSTSARTRKRSDHADDLDDGDGDGNEVEPVSKRSRVQSTNGSDEIQTSTRTRKPSMKAKASAETARGRKKTNTKKDGGKESASKGSSSGGGAKVFDGVVLDKVTPKFDSASDKTEEKEDKANEKEEATEDTTEGKHVEEDVDAEGDDDIEHTARQLLGTDDLFSTATSPATGSSVNDEADPNDPPTSSASLAITVAKTTETIAVDTSTIQSTKGDPHVEMETIVTATIETTAEDLVPQPPTELDGTENTDTTNNPESTPLNESIAKTTTENLAPALQADIESTATEDLSTAMDVEAPVLATAETTTTDTAIGETFQDPAEDKNPIAEDTSTAMDVDHTTVKSTTTATIVGTELGPPPETTPA